MAGDENEDKEQALREVSDKIGGKFDQMLAGAQGAFFASAGSTLSQSLQPIRELCVGMAVELMRLQQLCVESGIDPKAVVRGAGPVGPATSPTPAESIPAPPSAPTRGGQPLKKDGRPPRTRVRGKGNRKRAK